MKNIINGHIFLPLTEHEVFWLAKALVPEGLHSMRCSRLMNNYPEKHSEIIVMSKRPTLGSTNSNFGVQPRFCRP